MADPQAASPFRIGGHASTDAVRRPFLRELPQPVTVITSPHVDSAAVELIDPEGHGQPVWIEFDRVRSEHDYRVFEGVIPSVYTAHRCLARYVQRDVHGATVHSLPADGPAPLGQTQLWIHHTELFRYEPPLTVGPPREEEFYLTPRNFRGRRVRVLLPRGYDDNVAHRYPVLYLLDGQNVFYPGSIFGSWDVDVSATRLIARAEVQEIILVAIDNTEDRFAEYTPEYGEVHGVYGRAGEFLESLRLDLLPIVNHRYRTRPEPDHTGLMGSSLGGLCAYYAAHEFRHAFGICAALSPSFWCGWEENYSRAGRPPAQWSRIWIDSGCQGVNRDGYHNTRRIRQRMLEAGHEPGHRFQHMVALGAEHSERDWARRVPDILRWMFPPDEQEAPQTPLSRDLLKLDDLHGEF